MARASTPTLVPLDTWAQLMGINPFEFNQIGAGFPAEFIQTQCSEVFFQHPWQGGGSYLSREEIARTMQRAEYAIAQELGYWPAPKYVVGEQVQNQGKGLGYQAYYDYTSAKLRWKRIRASGVEARTVIRIGAAVVVSDNDGDGVDDLFTVTAATTVTDIDEIAIYFSAADRNNADIDETWRIRPVNVSITGGTVTITGHPSLLVKPDLTSTYTASVLDVTVDANFVSTVDVYRRYTDDTATLAEPNQGIAIYDDPDCTDEPCENQYHAICMGHLNSDAGVVMFRYSDTDTSHILPGTPDRFQVNYLSGARLVNGNVDPEMADIVAHLTTAWLPTGQCGCERSNRIIDYWRDLPRAGEIRSSNPFMSFKKMDYPFGNERGAIYAYERLQMLRSTGAVIV